MVHNIDQVKNTILEQSFSSLIQRGVRAFTIDAFAARLGMSKKTIYKYYPNKENLIERSFMNFTNSLNEKLDNLSKSNPHPVIIFMKSVEIIHTEMSRFTPSMLNELKIHYPAIWLKIEAFRKDRFKKLMANLRDGQVQGYIDKSIDLNITTTLLMQIINTTIQPELFAEHDLQPGDAFRTLFHLVTRGILTDKGLKYV
ncbi:TetR/AcrR family transcriptional regulator [Candidatus Neomarinimicrobiota bacterium]